MRAHLDNRPPERVERLKKLHAEGYSNSQIAAALGGLTRNAVIGKAHRLGLKRVGASAPSVTAPYPKREAPKGQRRGAPQLRSIRWADEPAIPSKPLPVASGDVLSPNAAPWTERDPGQCAYPVSGQGADTVSCCNPAEGEYCAGHRRIMFVVNGPRKLNESDLNFFDGRARTHARKRTFEAFCAA